tara:strand:- start:400 stop:603 length:204 start_codon:yes stop_codon:yes gene_type:complete
MLQDELGPYASIEECYLRGAQIIKSSAIKFPILSSYSNCTLEDPSKQNKKEKKEKLKGKTIKWNLSH